MMVHSLARSPGAGEDRTPALYRGAAALALAAVLWAGQGTSAAAAELQLLAPENGSDVEGVPAVFSWTDLGPEAHYRLRIVELGGAQSPAEALATNPPLYEADTDSPLFAYAPEGPHLAEGRGFAWQVVASLPAATATSPPYYFRMRFRSQKVSRADAISTVIHRLIVPPTLDHPVVAYLGRTLLQPDDQVWPWDEPGHVRRVTSPTWFAWINDDPQAFFAHDTRFVFIDAASGQVEVVVAGWWPVLNGESLWMSDSAWQDLEVVIYSELHEIREEQP